MKKLKKILKLTGIICLIFLASVGMGLTGAAPVLPKNRERCIDNQVKTELVEAKESEMQSTEIKT